MKFRNAYRGISRVLFAEILGMLPLLFLLFYSKLVALKIIPADFLREELPWIVLGTILLSGMLRVLSLGLASQDEVIFSLGQKLSAFSMLFYLANQFVLPRVVEYLAKAAYRSPANAGLFGFVSSAVQIVLPLGFVVTYVWVMLNVVAGVHQLALRIRKNSVEAQGRRLTMLILVLIFGALVMFSLPLFVSRATARSSTFQTVTLILVLAYLVVTLLCWLWYLLYLVQARRMLRATAKEETSPWANPSVSLDEDVSQPW